MLPPDSNSVLSLHGSVSSALGCWHYHCARSRNQHKCIVGLQLILYLPSNSPLVYISPFRLCCTNGIHHWKGNSPAWDVISLGFFFKVCFCHMLSYLQMIKLTPMYVITQNNVLLLKYRRNISVLQSIEQLFENRKQDHWFIKWEDNLQRIQKN